MSLDDALHKVKTARPQAHPYVDCWKVSPCSVCAHWIMISCKHSINFADQTTLKPSHDCLVVKAACQASAGVLKEESR